MNYLQATIIAAGIAAAGLLNGGIWEFHNKTGYLINKFSGEIDSVSGAPRR